MNSDATGLTTGPSGGSPPAPLGGGAAGSANDRSARTVPVSPMNGWRMRASAAAAAIVTAAAVFLPHVNNGTNLDTVNGCGLTGSAVTATEVRLNPLKNRYRFPTPQDMLPSLTLDQMLAATAGGLDDHKAAEIEGYVTLVKKGGIESCNCGTTDPTFMDTHIYVNATPQLDERHAVIVEVTPRLRQEMNGTANWSTSALQQMLPKGARARISGWLFYDAAHEASSENIHPNGARNWRGTCWEIHPVTGIEVEDAEQGPKADLPAIPPGSN